MAQLHGTLVTFELGEVRLAIPAAVVREVVRAVAVSPLPGAPAVVCGVIDVRGSMVPVFDTRLRFGMETRPVHPHERFVIVDTSDRVAALRVDDVGWMVDVPAAAVTPTERLTRGAANIAGTASLEDGVVLIHDVTTFLSRSEAETLEDALRRRVEAGTGAEPHA